MSAEWDTAMMRYRMAKMRADTEWAACKNLPDGHPDEELLGGLADQSGEEETAARTALLNMPAPDLAALRWKLDNVITFESFHGGEDYMDAWSRSYAHQTIVDYQRMLSCDGAVYAEAATQPR
jgi:hypothetical protein